MFEEHQLELPLLHDRSHCALGPESLVSMRGDQVSNAGHG